MIEIKNYQSKAISELTDKVSYFLNKSEKAVITFKSPTGSGKTFMVSESLKNIVLFPNSNISIVWISVRKLHTQSKEKLEKYFEDLRLLKCSYFSDLNNRMIGQNEILFINWESINRKNESIILRENELENDLNTIISNTKAEGRKILMIIDESHHTANTDRSRELINTISPDITVEVSATPTNKSYGLNFQVGRVEVKLSDVISEEMIKREVLVNPDFLSLKVCNQTSDELVLEQAIKKRDELAKLYQKEGSNVNPLLLIQLPDNKGGNANRKMADIVKYLDSEFNINVSNNGLAIWLSENKSNNLANIEKNDDEVKVLIFKQAISLGWDCPRATILVIFREMKSFIFTIQTVGRIMRMPEFKFYNDEELNRAYVFTNLDILDIEKGEAQDYLTVFESKRIKNYRNIKLRSVYVRRQRERTRLSGDFVKIFQRVAEECNVKTLLNLEPQTIIDIIIADGIITDVDKQGQIIYKGQIPIPSSPLELSEKFDMFIRKNASPYAMVDSSDRIKSAIYTFLKDKFGIPKYSGQAQKVVLAVENINIFEEVLQKSKERYEIDVIESIKNSSQFIENEEWEIPELVTYNEKYYTAIVQKSVVQPYYIYTGSSKPEKDFIKMIDKSNNVEWWFKNREDEPKYFSIGYINTDGFKASFYVDFIVKFKDGRIGLFDTKKGSTASNENARDKAESLQKYITEEKKRGKNLFGGIVVPIGNSSTVWRISSSESYSDDFDDMSKWNPFFI